MGYTCNTMAFVGCGNMGCALLQGFLDAVFLRDAGNPYKVGKVIACTNSEKSAKALEKSINAHGSELSVCYRSNLAAMKEADVIVLGFKPFMARDILKEAGVRESVAGKLVISLLAGLSVQSIRDIISEPDESPDLPDFWVAKAIPNLAARHGESMTILEQPPAEFPSHYFDFLQWKFGLVGRTKFLSESLVDVGSALVTSCLATLTVPLDGMLDGSVVEGFRRNEALDLVAQSVVGLGSLLSNGSHPAILREQISSPRGVTIQTLVAVERKGTRAIFTDALLQGTEHLRRLKEKSKS